MTIQEYLSLIFPLTRSMWLLPPLAPSTEAGTDMSLSVAPYRTPTHVQNLPGVVLIVPGNRLLKALLLGVILALGLFIGGAVTPQDSPLSALAPDEAAACGFLSTFNAKIDDANSSDGSDTDYAASGASSGYAGARVRVFITSASGDSGQQWCNQYKYNAFSETSTSATQWTYMGSSTAASSTCDYIANSRTSHRGYFFRGSGTGCTTGNSAIAYDPPSYGEGANAGWIRNLSCTSYAVPYAAWSTTGSAQKPHVGCQGTTVGMSPAGIDNGIFIDTVAPTAPTWTESGATSHKSGNTIYFRKVAATFSVTLTHTETLTSTKSGGKSFTWANMSASTGWSGYTSGEVASTTTSTKSFTSSTSSVNATLATDSNDRSDNDGSNLTITFTADASAPTVTWTAPTAQTTQAASSFNFTWTEADTGSGAASRTVQKQTAPVSGGNCGTFVNSGSAASNATTAFNYTGMVNNTCYRIIVATTDNVGNVASSTSSAILINTVVPSATISVDGADTDTYRVGNTVYYRGGVAGNVNITVTGSNPGGGSTDQRFNAMGGTTTGWAPTAATAYTTTNPYTLNYAWGSTSTGSATLSGTVRNASLVTTNTSTLSLTRDSTAPGLGFNYPAGPTIYTPDSTFTVDFNITEAGSGFGRAGAGWSLQRQRATVSSNVCGSYSNDGSPVTGQTSGLDQVSEQTGLEPGYCYKWALSATDSVGNTGSLSTVTTVIVDETDPTETVLSTNSSGAYVAGGTVFINSSAGGTLALTATSSDPETGITTIHFGAVTTAGGWSPTAAADLSATASAATKTYTWSTGASAADLAISADSGAGITSSALNVTFAPDNDNPTVTPIGRYRGQLLAANPVNYWRLGEASDTTATDIGSAAVDGTYTNGVTLGASGLLLNDVDKAATFDGVNDWVSIPGVPAISGSITLSGWVSTADNKNEYVLARGSQAYIRRITSLNRFTFSWLDSGAVQRTLSSAVDSAPADGQAHFVVATHDGSTVSIYVDGVLSNSLAGQSLQTVPSGTWGIGSNNTGSADLWSGKIDDVAIFNQALSANTVKSLYAFGSSPIQSSANYDVAWAGEDVQSGVLSYSVQRQRGPVVTAGTCTGVTYSNDGSATVTSNESLSGSGLTDGYCYRWAITATDYVGHTSSTVTSAVILIDTSGPVAAGAPTTSPTGFTASTSVTITAGAAASDPQSGVTETFYRQAATMTDGVCGSYGSATLVTSPNAVASGNCYTYFTRATNGAGATTDSASSAAVKVDASGPVAAGAPATSPTGFTNSTSVTITAGAAASDPQSGVTETFYRQAATMTDGVCGSYGSATLVTSPNAVANGNCYTYFTRATNGTGATADSTSSAAVKVDTIAPSAEFSVPDEAIAGDVSWDTDGSLNVTWTEETLPSGLASRSLQRQVASLENLEFCGAFSNVGSPTTSASPLAATITADQCHRWVLTLTSGSGEVGVITSPAVTLGSGPNYGMPIRLANGVTTLNSGGSAEMPTGIRSGDLAIWQMPLSATSLIGSPPAIPGWTLAFFDTQVGNSRGLSQAIYYRFLDGSEHGIQSASWNSNVDVSRITVFRGVRGGQPFEAAALASGFGTSIRTLPAVTTTGDNRLLTCFGTQTGKNALSMSGETGGDWIERYETIEDETSDGAIQLHTAAMPSAGTISGATGGENGWPWLQRCFALVPGLGSPSVAIAPSLRAGNSASITSSGTAVMPQGILEGDLALWHMGWNDNVVETVPAPPTISGWQLLQFDSATNGSSHTVASAIYYRFLDGSEGGATQTAFWGDDVDLAWINVYRGVDPNDPFDDLGVSGGSGTRTMPEITTTGDDRTVVAFVISTDDATQSHVVGGTGGIWARSGRATESETGTDSQVEHFVADMPFADTISGATSSNGSYPWLFHAIALNPSYEPDPPPAADFSEPDELTPVAEGTQASTQLEVTWTEAAAPEGLTITGRSLQRQLATAASYDACQTATFTNDGGASTSSSPVLAESLVVGKCYRWILTLTYSDSSTASVTSGTRYISPYGIELRHVPSAAAGESVMVTAVIVDADGQPYDGLTNTLTISTSDTLATFPGGETYTLQGPDDLTGHTFEVIFNSDGNYEIEVHSPGLAIGTGSITINETDLEASAPQIVYAGVSFLFEVTPVSSGQYNPRYAGTVNLTSSDPTADFDVPSGLEDDQHTFECNCEGSVSFPTRLSTLGTQTITATDDAGNSGQATVEVVAAPSATTSPISSVQVVQWRHGNYADFYVTAVPGAPEFTILGVQHVCGSKTLPGVRPNMHVNPGADRFVEFSGRVYNDGWCPDFDGSLPKPGTRNDTLDELAIHKLVVIDETGHIWFVTATRHLRFASVSGAANFRMINPGDPIAYMQVMERPGGTVITAIPNPPYIEKLATGDGTLIIDFYAYERAQTKRYFIGRPGVSAYREPALITAAWPLKVGQNFVAFTDYTHKCYFDSLTPLDAGWLTYGNDNGYDGAFAGGSGGFIPNPTSSAGNALCDTGGEDPPSDRGPLDDLIDWYNSVNWPNVGGWIEGVNRFMAADPIDPFNGSFTQVINDFSLGGLSPSLDMSRTYRSDRAEAAGAGDPLATGAFGPGWGSSIDQRLLILDSGERVVWRTSDGGVALFDLEGSVYHGVRTDVTLTTVSGGYRLETNNGSALLFNGNGRMTAMEDRDGRQLTFAYDGNGHLTSMTDAASRTADITVDGSGRITRVDLPDGRYVSFTYSTDGYLASARSISGTVINYITDTRGRLTELRNASNDLLLRNTYDDLWRVISQDDAEGNTTWLSYDAGGVMTQVTDPLGNTTTDCFLPSGHLDHSIDALGNVTAWTYDTNGNPTSTTDPLGQVTLFEYSANHLPTSVTDPLGRTQTIEYNADNLVTKVTDDAGNTVIPSYDANGRPESVVRAEPTSDPDPQSLEMATYTYNSLGLPEVITAAGGAGATLGYNATGYLTGVTDAEGRQITYTVDARGFVTAMVDALGNAAGGVPADHTSTYTYDNAGRVLTATNAEDETVTYTYDSMGRLLTTESPLGTLTTNTYDDDGRILSTTTELTDTTTATTTFEYDAAGNLIRITDAEDRETEFEYDALGRQVLQRDPNGEEWLTEYDALGRVVKTTDPTNRTSQTIYDAAGRVTKTIDAAGKETTYAYNDLDQLVTITDPLNRVTTNTYDWLGRQTELTNAEDETTISAFNDAGDLLSLTDAEGKTTTFTYDDTHRLLEVVDAALGETTFGYDAAGRMTSRTNARDKTEAFEYDNVGRQTSVTDADGSEWETYYDADGRIDFTIDGKGQMTEFSFDRAGRLLSIDPAGSMAAITYTYDDTGRQLTMSDAEGNSSFAYDNVGRLTSAVRDSQTVGYTYDEAGRPTSVVYPGSTGSVDYTYDSAGRLATISDWADRTTTMSYDNASRVTSLTRPAGLSTSFVYDDVDRLLNIDHVKSGSSLLELDYTYDDVGNVLTYADDSGTATFGYNDLHQLTSADYPGSNDFTYTYDAVGNMTGLTGTSEPGSPDTAAPSVPSGGAATSPAADQVDLTWTASTDNVGVIRYRIYRDSTQISEVSGSSTSFSDRSVAASTAYVYTVAAVDAAGNASAQSSAANVTTGAGGGGTSGESTKAPTTHDSGWTTSNNAYASDDVYTTAAPNKNQTTTLNVGTFGFDSTIPANATITGVTVTVEWKVSTTSSIATLGSQLYAGGVAKGTELVNSAEPTTDTTQTYTVSGLTRADLLDGTLTIRARTSRGNNNTAFTASLDVISIEVDYTTPPATDTTVPSVPADLTATAASSSQIDLDWTASTDNVAVQGYRIYRDSTLIATTASTDFADTGLDSDTAYDYTIAAIDGAGNASDQTSAASDTTPDENISLTRTYSDGDRLLTEDDGTDTRTFVYDDNGSMTDDGAGRTFTYDAMGRLTSVNGAVDATYAYDGAGRRISATVDSVTTDFLLDIRGMGSVLDDGTRRFLPGGPNGGYEEAGAWVNALTNHQGTVLGYADNAGLVGSLAHFDPYGSPLPGSEAAAAGPGFTGEWTDATGLVNLRFRAYDPTLQAFFGRDTFGGVASAPLSGNRYAYALGNPLRYTDPSGHFANEFKKDPGMFASTGLQMVPLIGDAYSLFTGLTGFDPIANYSLSGLERGLSMAAALPFVPGLGNGLARLGGRAGDDLLGSADNFAAKTFGRAYHNPSLSGQAREEAFDALQHSRRTGFMMEPAARYAGGKASTWRAAGILHDVGKPGPARGGRPILEIISHPEGLSVAERKLVGAHSVMGGSLIRRQFGDEIADAVRAHHMYNAPRLTDMQKFLQGADVYDALRSARAYKGGLDHAAAIGVMRSNGNVAPGVIDFFESYGAGLYADALDFYPGAYGSP